MKKIRKVRSTSYIEPRDKNEIYILYNIEENNSKDNKIKLFSHEFVKRNKDNCSLMINDKKMELCEYYKYDKVKEKGILEVLFIEEKTMTDISYMFNGCTYLYSISKII